MHDVATITLIILTVVLLRRSLLTEPDADNGVRDGKEEIGSKAVPVPVETGLPQPVRRKRSRFRP